MEDKQDLSTQRFQATKFQTSRLKYMASNKDLILAMKERLLTAWNCSALLGDMKPVFSIFQYLKS